MLRCLPLMLCIAAASCAIVPDHPKHPHHQKQHHSESLNRDDDRNEAEIHSLAELLEQWNQFKSAYEKSYTNSEEEKRKTIFADNMKKIKEHNKQYDEGKVSYTMAMNQFGDMTGDEFLEHIRCRPIETNHTTPKTKDSDIPRELLDRRLRIPDTLDWRGYGVVSRVKNQGRCGSCWAFSAVATLESQVMLRKGEPVLLSEQNLVDCATGPGYRNKGCRGGYAADGMRYVEANRGIDTGDMYPYEAENGRCRYRSLTKAENLDVLHVFEILEHDEELLKLAVGYFGPVSAGIYADKRLHFYSSGIFYSPDKGRVNHDVQVVGYATSSPGRDYWVIKNSWGQSWGMDGFLLLARNKNSVCQIGKDIVIPILG